MGRKSLTKEDYVDAGRKRSLELISEPPISSLEKAIWRCSFCGTIHAYSMKSLTQKEYGCRCQNRMTLKDADYYALAKRLGICWTGVRPINTKHLTQWTGKNGVTVKASYHDLAYSHIHSSLRMELGLIHE